MAHEHSMSHDTVYHMTQCHMTRHSMAHDTVCHMTQHIISHDTIKYTSTVDPRKSEPSQIRTILLARAFKYHPIKVIKTTTTGYSDDHYRTHAESFQKSE